MPTVPPSEPVTPTVGRSPGAGMTRFASASFPVGRVHNAPGGATIDVIIRPLDRWNHVATTVQEVDAPGDAELISAVRGGDVDAYGQLFERHVDAARRLARQLVAAGDVEDLVSDAFVKVLAVLQRGGGPDVAFRAYLLTAVRRLRVDRLRAGSRLQSSDDMEMFDPGVPFRDTAVEGFESEAAARAFASLPERWQLVLWHTEVEGQKPAEVAPLLGMSPNSVSALAYRAREGLRQAFLNQHAQEMDEDTCRWTHEHLGGYIRNGLSRRDTGKVEAHLQDCRRCAAIYLELTEVNDNLAGILAPLLLGGVAASYVGTTGAAATGGLAALLDRLKDALANPGAAIAGGVAATAVVAAGVWALTTGHESTPPPPAAAESAPQDTDTPSGADPGTAPGQRDRATRPGTGPGDTAPAPSIAPAPAPAPAPTPASPAPADDTLTPAEVLDDSADDPADAPADEPAPGSDVGPADEPGEGSGLEQDAPAPPAEEPPAEEPPPAVDDLRVTATYTDLAGATGTVQADIAGVTAPTIVTVTSSGLVTLESGDCSSVTTGGTFTCEVSADTRLRFRYASVTGGTMSFTVTSSAEDSDDTNNVAEVRLPGVLG